MHIPLLKMHLLAIKSGILYNNCIWIFRESALTGLKDLAVKDVLINNIE